MNENESEPHVYEAFIGHTVKVNTGTRQFIFTLDEIWGGYILKGKDEHGNLTTCKIGDIDDITTLTDAKDEVFEFKNTDEQKINWDRLHKEKVSSRARRTKQTKASKEEELVSKVYNRISKDIEVHEINHIKYLRETKELMITAIAFILTIGIFLFVILGLIYGLDTMIDSQDHLSDEPIFYIEEIRIEGRYTFGIQNSGYFDTCLGDGLYFSLTELEIIDGRLSLITRYDFSDYITDPSEYETLNFTRFYVVGHNFQQASKTLQAFAYSPLCLEIGDYIISGSFAFAEDRIKYNGEIYNL